MRLKALIGATLLAVAAAATFAWTPPAPAGPAMPDPGRLAKLRAQAEQSCRCARAQPDEAGKDRCWAAFEQAVAPYPHGEAYTLCEFSQKSICFDGGRGEDCIATGWSAPVGPPRSLCTEQEVRIAEAVWGDGSKPRGQELARTLAAFARNDRVSNRQSSGGCGGG